MLLNIRTDVTFLPLLETEVWVVVGLVPGDPGVELSQKPPAMSVIYRQFPIHIDYNNSCKCDPKIKLRNITLHQDISQVYTLEIKRGNKLKCKLRRW